MGNTLDELFIMDTFTTLEAILLQLRKTLKTGSTIPALAEKLRSEGKFQCSISWDASSFQKNQ